MFEGGGGVEIGKWFSDQNMDPCCIRRCCWKLLELYLSDGNSVFEKVPSRKWTYSHETILENNDDFVLIRGIASLTDRP